jgi:hypothetical protein
MEREEMLVPGKEALIKLHLRRENVKESLRV